MASNYQTFIDYVDGMFENGNVDTDTKESVVSKLNTALSSFSDQSSPQFIAMNKLKSRVLNAPFINLKLRRVNIENSNLPEKLSLAYKALRANDDIDLINISTLTNATDISSITYLKQVKAAALSNPALSLTNASTKELLVPITSIADILSTAQVTDNDSHRPNDIPVSTTGFLSMDKDS